jgi:hypothetical protein
MKIEGPGGPQGPSKTKGKGKTEGSGGRFGELISGGTQSAAPTQATYSIAQLDSLLALQGAEDPAHGAARKRARQRSNTILTELDKIRMAMLGGTLTVGHMIDVADVVASHREKIMDPAMTAIMDEIDLRAQVELAKMRMALEAQSRPQGSAA